MATAGTAAKGRVATPRRGCHWPRGHGSPDWPSRVTDPPDAEFHRRSGLEFSPHHCEAAGRSREFPLPAALQRSHDGTPTRPGDSAAGEPHGRLPCHVVSRAGGSSTSPPSRPTGSRLGDAQVNGADRPVAPTRGEQGPDFRVDSTGLLLLFCRRGDRLVLLALVCRLSRMRLRVRNTAYRSDRLEWVCAPRRPTRRWLKYLVTCGSTWLWAPCSPAAEDVPPRAANRGWFRSPLEEVPRDRRPSRPRPAPSSSAIQERPVMSTATSAGTRCASTVVSLLWRALGSLTFGKVLIGAALIWLAAMVGAVGGNSHHLNSAAGSNELAAASAEQHEIVLASAQVGGDGGSAGIDDGGQSSWVGQPGVGGRARVSGASTASGQLATDPSGHRPSLNELRVARQQHSVNSANEEPVSWPLADGHGHGRESAATSPAANTRTAASDAGPASALIHAVAGSIRSVVDPVLEFVSGLTDRLDGASTGGAGQSSTGTASASGRDSGGPAAREPAAG